MGLMEYLCDGDAALDTLAARVTRRQYVIRQDENGEQAVFHQWGSGAFNPFPVPVED